MAKLDMLDVSPNEYVKLKERHENFFSHGMFYLKNDKNYYRGDHDSLFVGRSSDEHIGVVYPNKARLTKVLFCKTSNLNNFRKLKTIRVACDKRVKEDDLVEFFLKNGTRAYMTIVRMLDGTEQIGIVIPSAQPDDYTSRDNPVEALLGARMDIPYSYNGNTRYGDACKEEGTLPYMVENDIIYDMIPSIVKNLMGVEEITTEEMLEDIKMNPFLVDCIQGDVFVENEEKILKAFEEGTKAFIQQKINSGVAYDRIEKQVKYKITRFDSARDLKKEEAKKIKSMENNIKSMYNKVDEFISRTSGGRDGKK